MRKVEQCLDEIKTDENSWETYLDDMWEEMGWDEKSWDEVRWDEVWSVMCEVWRAQSEVWRKCSLGVALQRGRTQVMFLDGNSARRMQVL